MKNMQKIFAAVCFIAMAAISFTGCVDQDFDQPEVKVIKFEGKANKTIAEIRAMHEKGKIEQFTNEDVITGYVVSSDTDGNFYKSIVIQDAAENPTAGIEVKINEKGLSAIYPVGQQVFIKLKDLYMGDYNGLVQIGGGTYKKGNYINLSGIESAMMDSHIFVNGTPVDITAKPVTLEELKSNYIVSTLVKINGVQFQSPDGLTYAEKASKESSATNRTIEDAKGNTLTIRNSGYSKFYDVPLPTGSGSLTVVLSQFGKTNQGTIRNTADADMTGERLTESTPDAPAVNATIADIKALREAKKFVTITDDKVIEGVIISSDEHSNFYKTLVIQETKDGAPLTGIQVSVNAKELYKKYAVGQKIVINCKGLVVADNYGFAKLGGSTYTQDNKTKLGGIDPAKLSTTIFKVGAPAAVTPKTVKISELTNNLLSCLIKIDNVQFTDADKDKTYGESKKHATRTIINAEGKTVVMSTSGYASFITDKLPQGSGSITSILNTFSGKFQLNIRSTADIDMNGDRFTVGGGGTATESNATINDIKALREAKKFVTITDDKVIEGVVISTDENGLFYKTLVIQETKEGAPLSGIQVAVNKKGLHNIYPIGQKVIVKCKNLIVADNYGFAKLGGSTYTKDGKTKLGGIAEDALATTIVKVGTPTAVTPKTVKISELTNDLMSCLIKIDNVQFIDADKDKTYAESKGYATRTLTTAEGNTVVMSTSSYASFKNDKLPQGSGSITSILNSFSGKFQLNIRATSDLDMNGNRFTVGGGSGGDTGTAPTPNKTIADIIALYSSGAAVEITGDFAFDGVVTSNQKESGAFFRAVYIQDETAAIKLYVDDADYYKTLALNQKVIVNAKGLFVIKKDYGGVMVADAKFTKISNDLLKAKVFTADGGVAPTPVAKNIADLSDNLLMQVIQITNVQVADADKAKKISEKPTFTDAKGNTVQINGNKYVTYKDVILPTKSGSITGILGKYSGKYTLTLRNTNSDVDLTKDRFTVEGGSEGGGDTGGSTGTDNLVSNGGFEKWDSDTKPSDFDKAENVTKEATIKHSGEFSAKQQAGTKDINVKVAIEAGATYEISYWLLDNDATAKSRLWSKFRDASNADVTDADSKKLFQPSTYSSDKADWQQVKFNVTAPTGATKLEFEVRTYKDGGTGFIYYDDIVIKKK